VAVYERTYRPYTGPTTPARWRFLVFPRYAWEEVFASKLFVGFLALCWVWPLVLAGILYLPHNLTFLENFDIDATVVKDAFLFDSAFFLNWFLRPYLFVSLLVTIIVAPALVSADLRNNGLALYFSRPITRTEYVLGKMAVLVTLLSAVTWVPGMLLFFWQVYLEGPSWVARHGRAGIGILVGSLVWILLLCLLGLAVSAYVKWRPVARLGLILVFFVAGGMSALLQVWLASPWPAMLNLSEMAFVVLAWLFGVPTTSGFPVAAAWAVLFLACAACLVLLARKLRPYEVVR